MEIILSVLVCFLAVYGVFKLLYKVVYYYYDLNKVRPKFHHTVIALNDDCENIEAYVRAAVMREEEDIIILDYSRMADTKKLLKIIDSEFYFVTVMTPEQYITYIQGENWWII